MRFSATVDEPYGPSLAAQKLALGLQSFVSVSPILIFYALPVVSD
jgi:hypothetical protein